MEMIAMLGGLGRTPPGSAPKAAAAVQNKAEQAVVDATKRIKEMDDATLLGAAQAALANKPFGDSRAEQIAAVAPQLYAEVVARFGPGKLVELAPKPEAAVAAVVQAETAKSADRMSPVMAGLIGGAAGVVLTWWMLRRR